FLKADFPAEESSWLITNPPYGKRLNTQDLAPLYEKLLASYQGNWQGGFITSYPLAPMEKDTWNEKKLFNGDEECSFWWRKK
ncbi:MAG: class I SAM-dependent RNA methyltransferase, partial [candidate division SR1 bacterium]